MDDSIDKVEMIRILEKISLLEEKILSSTPSDNWSIGETSLTNNPNRYGLREKYKENSL